MTADRARARSATAPPPPFVQLSARNLYDSETLSDRPEAIEWKAVATLNANPSHSGND